MPGPPATSREAFVACPVAPIRVGVEDQQVDAPRVTRGGVERRRARVGAAHRDLLDPAGRAQTLAQPRLSLGAQSVDTPAHLNEVGLRNVRRVQHEIRVRGGEERPTSGCERPETQGSGTL